MKKAPILSLLACLSALPAQANNHHGTAEGLSAADWQEMTEARFRDLDRNSDGQVTAEELAQGRPRVLRRLQAPPSAHGDRHVLLLPPPPPLEDSDGDGVVTWDEALTGAQARFQALDADGDGQLRPAELPPPAFPPGD